MKIVINTCYGGFGLSEQAQELLDVRKGYHRYIKRDDPDLVDIVEGLGTAANSECSMLKIVEIPDDVEWEIDEDDGLEWVAEKHRRWS